MSSYSPKNTNSFHGKHIEYNQSSPEEPVRVPHPFFHGKEFKTSRFQYIFPKIAEDIYTKHYEEKPHGKTIKALISLAELMVETEPPTHNSDIPAGFTYFGQFIDHDISAGTDRSHPFLITEKIFDPIHPHSVIRDLVNRRTAGLDLDSVYGGPGAAFLHFPQFYQKTDPLKFKIGFNQPNPPFLPDPELKNSITDPQRDLPRLGLLSRREKKEVQGLKDMPDTLALIGDMRNDENLIIAQFHLAFLKFHNRLIDDFCEVSRGKSQTEIFLLARKELTLVYQWLVVHQFLAHILDPDIFKQIQAQKETLFDVIKDRHGNTGHVFMPLEFSTAAFRFGHSMVRNQYDFNLNFGRGSQATLPRASFDLLIEFTGKGAINSDFFKDKLPQNWIIQWDRFFEVSNQTDSLGNPIQDRYARKIDTQLADFITNPGMRNEEYDSLTDEQKVLVKAANVSVEQFNSIMKHLAKRNLLRGFLLNMPAAQVLIEKINELKIGSHAISIEKLSSDELQAGNSAELNKLLNQHDLLTHTPLWFYILKEAEVKKSGNSLGQLGSWIVGQTLWGLIKKSSLSIYTQDKKWEPTKSKIPALKSLKNMMDFMIYAKVAIDPHTLPT